MGAIVSGSSGSRLALVLGAAVASLLTAGQKGDRSRVAATDSTRTADSAPSDVVLKLPEGFTATVFAQNLGSTRHIVAALNNNIYVQISGQQVIKPRSQRKLRASAEVFSGPA